MEKKTLSIIANSTQEIPKNLHVSGYGSKDTEPVVTFLKDKHYVAKVVNESCLLAVGEDGEEYRVGGDGDGCSYLKDDEFLQNFTVMNPPISVIETDIYVPNLENPGFLKKERDKTIEEVYLETVNFLKEQGLLDELDYFTIEYVLKAERATTPFPRWRWIACYAVVGGNEGHYIHVDAITSEGKHIMVFTGKTFSGMDFALKVSNLLTKAFWDELK